MFSGISRDVLMNAQCLQTWWSNLKRAVFGSSLSVPPLTALGGGLVCESASKTDLQVVRSFS